MERVKEIISYFNQFLKPYGLTVFDLALFLGIIVFARLLVWFISRVVLKKVFIKNEIREGRRFATTQLFKYFIYTIAAILALESIGVDFKLLLAGSAALLVGVGLGMQQIFNDLLSGLILLFDGSVKVGDIIQVEDKLGEVKKISIRTTHIETRERVMILIPNSKLTGGNVVNWSYSGRISRFRVHIGVAYGSDIDLVKKLMLQAAAEHPKVIESPPTLIRFNDFGDSALLFELYFSSREILRIQDVLSDLRYSVEAKFRANDVRIPFPQRDVNFKNPIVVEKQ